MKNRKYAYLLMAILILSLSACVDKTKGVSEAVVRKDIVDAFSIDDQFIKLLDYTLKNVTVKDDKCVAKAEIVIEDSRAKSTLSVTLQYMFGEKKWVFVSKESETLSAITKYAPLDTEARQIWMDARSAPSDSFFSVTPTFQFKEVGGGLIETIPDNEHGKVTFIFENRYEMADTQAQGTTVVVGHYTYEAGWTYAIEDWSYVETTVYLGQYKITFDDPMLNAETWFTKGETVTLELDGIYEMRINKGQDPIFTNTLTGQMIQDQVSTSLTISPETTLSYINSSLHSYAVKLTFGSAQDAYLVLWLRDNPGHGGDGPFVPYWEGVDGNGNSFSVNHIRPIGID